MLLLQKAVFDGHILNDYKVVAKNIRSMYLLPPPSTPIQLSARQRTTHNGLFRRVSER
jgi:hypothetical protein